MLTFNNTPNTQNNDENTIIVDTIGEKDIILKSSLTTEYVLATPLEDITNDDLFVSQHWDPEEILQFICALHTHSKNTHDRGLMDDCEEQENYWRKMVYNKWDVYDTPYDTPESHDTSEPCDPPTVTDHPNIDSPQTAPFIIKEFTNKITNQNAQQNIQQNTQQYFRQYYDSLIYDEKRETLPEFDDASSTSITVITDMSCCTTRH
jgi:hypothetical protein